MNNTHERYETLVSALCTYSVQPSTAKAVWHGKQHWDHNNTALEPRACHVVEIVMSQCLNGWGRHN